MEISQMMQHLENKTRALEKKMQTAKEKGMLDLYELFNKEWADTQVTLRMFKKAHEDIHFYTNAEVRDKFIKYLLEEVPDLALYFKTDTITKVLTDAAGKAFDRVEQEHFKSRVVSLVEG